MRALPRLGNTSKMWRQHGRSRRWNHPRCDLITVLYLTHTRVSIPDNLIRVMLARKRQQNARQLTLELHFASSVCKCTDLRVPTHAINGNMTLLFRLYLSPNSLRYRDSFFKAHRYIWPTASTAKTAVLRLKVTIHIPIQARVSKV